MGTKLEAKAIHDWEWTVRVGLQRALCIMLWLVKWGNLRRKPAFPVEQRDGGESQGLEGQVAREGLTIVQWVFPSLFRWSKCEGGVIEVDRFDCGGAGCGGEDVAHQQLFHLVIALVEPMRYPRISRAVKRSGTCARARAAGAV